MAKRTQEIWIVYEEWQNDEPSVIAAFTGKNAEQRAGRFAEELRHGIATGARYGRPKSVWNYEGNDDSEWEIDVHVEQVETNPKIPSVYRTLVRRRQRKAEQRRAARSARLAQSPMDGAL